MRQTTRSATIIPLLVAIALAAPSIASTSTPKAAAFDTQIARLKTAHDPVGVLLASAAIGDWEPSPRDLAWRAPAADPRDPTPLVTALLTVYASETNAAEGELPIASAVSVEPILRASYASVPLETQRALYPLLITIAHASTLVNEATSHLTLTEKAALFAEMRHHASAERGTQRAQGIDLTPFGIPDAPTEQLAELLALHTPAPLAPREAARLAGLIDMREMVTAAALVTRAGLDARATINQAVIDGAWPKQQIEDPVGILDLGTTGNDGHSGNRWIIIDPAGDDLYAKSNAGGNGALLHDIAPGPQNDIPYPASLALDMAGNDTFASCDDSNGWEACDGGGGLGIGVLLEMGNGTDSYHVGSGNGWGSLGVGVFYDEAGNDNYWDDGGAGYATNEGLGMFYDEAGNDASWGLEARGLEAGWLPAAAGLWGTPGVAVYKDDSGDDAYATCCFGTTDGIGTSIGGFGVFLDQGGGRDAYDEPYARDNATWGISLAGGVGYGSDS
ncbi:MAG: hypothetical protein ACYDCK_00445 [Thermoplasmatota archaeon]